MSLESRIKRAATTVLTLVLVLLIIAIGEYLQPLQDLDTFLRQHASLTRALQVVTVGMAILGTLALVGAQFLPEPRSHRGPPSRPAALSPAELEAHAPPMEYEEVAEGAAREFAGEASFAAVKEAWRLRSWRYARRWRILFVMMGGALLLLVGLFGLICVIAPPGIKLLFGGALLYALVRTAWGFAQA